MVEFTISKTVRFEGKYCGAGGEDCDFCTLSGDMVVQVCSLFKEEQGDFDLSSCPEDEGTENEDRHCRCEKCIEEYGEG